MSKNTYYFPHDYNARNDEKLQVLMIDTGAEGYGIYWGLVEVLHEESSHSIELTTIFLKSFAKQMSTSVEQVLKCVECSVQLGLFFNSENVIKSTRVDKNILVRSELSEKRSKAGKESALKRQQVSTHVEQVSTKEKKRKEIKKELPLPLLGKHPINTFVDTLGKIRGVENQPTDEQWEELIKKFGEGMVRDVLLAMENYQGLQKKYTSVYLTCNNWCKRRKETNAPDESRPIQKIV
jgi:hypothetical protein